MVWRAETTSLIFLFKLYNFKYNLFYLYNNTVVLILYVPYEIKRLTLTWFSWLNLQKLIIVARIIFFWVQEKKKVGTLMLRKTEGNFVRVKLNFYFNLQVEINDNNVKKVTKISLWYYFQNLCFVSFCNS